MNGEPDFKDVIISNLRIDIEKLQNDRNKPSAELLEEIRNIVSDTKSTAELFIPRHAEDIMLRATINTVYVTYIPLGGISQLIIRGNVRSSKLIEIEFCDINNERLGLVNIRREI